MGYQNISTAGMFCRDCSLKTSYDGITIGHLISIMAIEYRTERVNRSSVPHYSVLGKPIAKINLLASYRDSMSKPSVVYAKDMYN